MTDTKEKNKKEVSTAQSIIGVLVAVGLVWYFFGGGFDAQVESGMQDIYGKVSSDSVEQYYIASRNGTAMDKCVQAGLVTASFLQAKDEANYKKWKVIESNDCAAAGLPR